MNLATPLSSLLCAQLAFVYLEDRLPVLLLLLLLDHGCVCHPSRGAVTIDLCLRILIHLLKVNTVWMWVLAVHRLGGWVEWVVLARLFDERIVRSIWIDLIIIVVGRSVMRAFIKRVWLLKLLDRGFLWALQPLITLRRIHRSLRIGWVLELRSVCLPHTICWIFLRLFAPISFHFLPIYLHAIIVCSSVFVATIVFQNRVLISWAVLHVQGIVLWYILNRPLHIHCLNLWKRELILNTNVHWWSSMELSRLPHCRILTRQLDLKFLSIPPMNLRIPGLLSYLPLQFVKLPCPVVLSHLNRLVVVLWLLEVLVAVFV